MTSMDNKADDDHCFDCDIVFRPNRYEGGSGIQYEIISLVASGEEYMMQSGESYVPGEDSHPLWPPAFSNQTLENYCLSTLDDAGAYVVMI